jgi:hypothetical protein
MKQGDDLIQMIWSNPRAVGLCTFSLYILDNDEELDYDVPLIRGSASIHASGTILRKGNI